MDLLEKRIIYLKGVQSGITQGANPNVSKYKMQLDYEIQQLEKQFHQTQSQSKPLPQSQIQIQNKPKVHIVEEEKEKEHSDLNKDHLQFLDVSKKINLLNDQIFQNNNQIKVLSRNKTYQNSAKIQHILKQNVYIQSQIHRYQSLYDMLNMKIQNYPLYQKMYELPKTQTTQTTPRKEPIKSILKKSTPDTSMKVEEVKVEAPKQKTLIFKKSTPPPSESESDEKDLMKEFQSTLGALQKLLA